MSRSLATRALLVGLTLARAGASGPAAADTGIRQDSTGRCSPNLAAIQAPVTFRCEGIDQAVVDELVADLREWFGSVDAVLAALDARIAEVLEVGLATRDAGDTLAAEAARRLGDDDLDGARAILTQLIERDRAVVERLAHRHYERGRTWDLQYDRPKAVADYRDAHRLDPDSTKIAEALASALWRGNRFDEAAALYRALAERYRRAPDREVELARTLGNPGNQLRGAGRLAAARAAYSEALEVFRQLAERDPEAYLADVAVALYNLGGLNVGLRDFRMARPAYSEALEIRHRLAERDPAAYLPNPGHKLHDAAILLTADGDPECGLRLIKQAKGIFQTLAREAPTPWKRARDLAAQVEVRIRAEHPGDMAGLDPSCHAVPG